MDDRIGSNWLDVRVQAIRLEAPAVRSLELRRLDGRSLPAFTAGAHLDVQLPDAAERSYSLLNDPAETDRYVIAVKREVASRGGSAFMCDSVRVGDELRIMLPANRFILDEDAVSSVFIAGGIGITPLLSMIRRLESLKRQWMLFYSCSSHETAPFLDTLQALQSESGRVVIRIGVDRDVPRFDLAKIVASQAPGTHFYCCGPIAMLQAFEVATGSVEPSHVHLEYFTSDKATAAGGFEVVLARSGRTVRIPESQTILETLLAEGMSLPRSCMEGVCGTCETVVLEGVPDHRDHVLSAREKRSNRKMIICRSGYIGDRLVLDL